MVDMMNALRQAVANSDPRQCTCHPDDNPPRPCTQKYALTECRRAALLRDVRDTMRHAQVFISSREKMHPDGQRLYREVLDAVETAMSN